MEDGLIGKGGLNCGPELKNKVSGSRRDDLLGFKKLPSFLAASRASRASFPAALHVRRTDTGDRAQERWDYGTKNVTAWEA